MSINPNYEIRIIYSNVKCNPFKRKEKISLDCYFLDDKLDNYLQNISGPNNSDKYCSRLSPHLTYGTLSVKEIYKKLLQKG